MPTLITLLVVDESADVRKFLTRGLTRMYPEIIVIETRSIQQAVQMVQFDVVTCVLTNYELPDGIAHALLTSVRGHAQHVPIIGMSSVAERGHELLAAGAVGFLHKPFSLDQLVAVLEQAVSGFRNERRG